ncbi:MAG: OmpA family protein [Gammaproteobacteria bacterium]|nr:OmpA family protein [Gammaproteobacteria bacterium]
MNEPQSELYTLNDIITATVYFEFNSDILKKESQSTVSTLKTLIEKKNDLFIVVSGFASSDGREDYNMNLSQKRINKVANELKIDFKDKNHISLAFGESEARKNEKGKHGKELEYQRQLNRKATLLIMPVISSSLIKERQKKSPSINLNLPPGLNSEPETPAQPGWLNFEKPTEHSTFSDIEKAIRKVVTPCFGNYCTNILDSLNLSYQLTTNPDTLKVLSDEQKKFNDQVEEQKQLMLDLQNPNRKFPDPPP